MSVENQSLKCQFCFEDLPTLDDRLDHELLEHDGVTMGEGLQRSTADDDSAVRDGGDQKGILSVKNEMQVTITTVGSKRSLTNDSQPLTMSTHQSLDKTASPKEEVLKKVKKSRNNFQPTTTIVVSGNVQDSLLCPSTTYSKLSSENEASRVVRLDDFNEIPYSTTSIMSFKCSLCGEVIMPEKAFRVHVRANHKGKSPLMACIICAAPVSSMDSLSFHTWQHHRLMWKCSLDYNAMMKPTISQHIKIQRGYEDKKPSKFLLAFQNYQLSVAICFAGYLKESSNSEDSDLLSNFSCTICQISCYNTRKDILLHYEACHGIKLVGFFEEKPVSNVCTVNSPTALSECPDCRHPFYTSDSYTQNMSVCSGRHPTECFNDPVKVDAENVKCQLLE